MGKRLSARIVGWVGLGVVMLVALTVTAFALARGNGNTPPKRPLAVALHNALTAPAVAGVSAQFTVSQHLLPGSSSFLSSSPLAGATGTVWAGQGRVRVEVHSQLGTDQLSYDGSTVTLYDAKHHAGYVLPVRSAHHAADAKSSKRPPSLSDITRMLAQISPQAAVSGATPDNIAGRPAYTVRVSARHDSGLFGPLALAWDAAHGTPLHVALYARGSSTPALELTVTHISYGALPLRDLTVSLPHGTHTTRLHLPSKSKVRSAAKQAKATDGIAAARHVGFPLAAPAKLAGMTRELVKSNKDAGVLIVYGHGLGSIVVIERKAGGAGAGQVPSLPTSVSVNGAKGRELETTLGTIVTFTRGGVSFTVLGSQPAATILSAAASLR
ncbi:MAG: hypothetical protein QOG33_2134 [Gaiellales bacterium]|jgi:hypothetical protein|nr:hypothetical protein [Gaiellales bacterium]